LDKFRRDVQNVGPRRKFGDRFWKPSSPLASPFRFTSGGAKARGVVTILFDREASNFYKIIQKIDKIGIF
jgi:hypothetical protein